MISSLMCLVGLLFAPLQGTFAQQDSVHVPVAETVDIAPESAASLQHQVVVPRHVMAGETACLEGACDTNGISCVSCAPACVNNASIENSLDKQNLVCRRFNVAVRVQNLPKEIRPPIA